jgi:hypothetical protein
MTRGSGAIHRYRKMCQSMSPTASFHAHSESESSRHREKVVMDKRSVSSHQGSRASSPSKLVFTTFIKNQLVLPSGRLLREPPQIPALPTIHSFSYKQNGLTCTPMFIAALFTTAKLWKQPRCPTTDKWIKKMWYLYTMKFYSARKKNEILSFASKWMELENIILSEVSQAQKTKIICSPSYVDFRSRTNTAMLLDLGYMIR